MKIPAIPENEKQRLADLQSLDLLDTDEEEQFDRLTRMAQRVFSVPIALVSLVDEQRQWFKSCIGLDATETTRDISFCGHTILDDSVLVVEDTEQDPRFANNPLVVGEPGIRFYAGCPIKLPTNSKLGTLCILDTQPRTMSEEDISMLKMLTSMVENEMLCLQAANQDELTMVLNRRGFFTDAQQGIDYCRQSGSQAVMIFFDIVNFKAVNDKIGYSKGDCLLKKFADVLQTNFRGTDTIGRIGGDEFAILMRETDIRHAENSLDRFHKAITRENASSNFPVELHFHASLVAFNPVKHIKVGDLLEQCDDELVKYA